jgi:isoquinoline 1-oxidoreductase subunit beta
VRRRSLILSGAAAAGALVVGWGFMPMRSRVGRADTLPPAEGAVGLNGWIRIAGDGTAQLAMHRSEMGQGIHTALAMLVAEELDLPLAKVALVPAGHDSLYGNVAMFVTGLPFQPDEAEPGHETRRVRASQWMIAKLARELGINATGGSSTMADAWNVLPLAAATARAQLLGAASLAWKLPAAELVVSQGVISHASGPRAHYGEFARTAAATPPGEVRLKQRKAWTLIGTPAPRADIQAKSNGGAAFGIDVRLPAMVYAVVRHSPQLGGSPGATDTTAALKLPGVERVVRLPSYAGSTAALAVVGRTSWHARRGAQALDVDWRPPPAGTHSTAAIQQRLEAAARGAAQGEGGFAFTDRGDADGALRGAARRIEAVYRAPYLAHATMEPINCTARVADGKVEVWAPTQVPGLARGIAARVAGVEEDAVTVHVTYLGGGFGRRLDVDFVGQAVRVALETGGRPVQLLWPREEDIGHDFYRPAGVALMEAGLDAAGKPVALRITSAGDAPTPRWMERAVAAHSAAAGAALASAGDLDVPRAVQPLLGTLAGALMTPDKTAGEGLFDLPYAVPNRRVVHVATRSGVPVGFWRSVGHSHNAFFAEAFVDELAAEAKQDPVAFRLEWLTALPRHAAVLRLAAEKAGWGKALPAGRARGVALHESFGSIVAQVVEASLVGGRPRVHRVVCAADVGTVVNPAIVAQQMESGVIFGLTAALYGRIDIEASVVKQSNFADYPLLRLAETPAIETHLVPSDDPPGGVGEPGTPPVAPALANALFVLTGKRMRELPLAL